MPFLPTLLREDPQIYSELKLAHASVITSFVTPFLLVFACSLLMGAKQNAGTPAFL
jgi:hypothetical protein